MLIGTSFCGDELQVLSVLIPLSESPSMSFSKQAAQEQPFRFGGPSGASTQGKAYAKPEPTHVRPNGGQHLNDLCCAKLSRNTTLGECEPQERQNEAASHGLDSTMKVDMNQCVALQQIQPIRRKAPTEVVFSAECTCMPCSSSTNCFIETWGIEISLHCPPKVQLSLKSIRSQSHLFGTGIFITC